jgi:hypothetical protein
MKIELAHVTHAISLLGMIASNAENSFFIEARQLTRVLLSPRENAFELMSSILQEPSTPMEMLLQQKVRELK